MDFTYNGKSIIPTKGVLNELNKIDLDLYGVVKILETGFEVRKREKNIIERAITKKNKVTNVVIADMDSYYKLIHVGEFTLTKKFREKMEDKNELWKFENKMRM